MTDAKPTEVFARRLRQALEEKGLNTVSLGALIGVKKQTVSKWLACKSFPSGKHLDLLVEKLEHRIGWFFGNDDVAGQPKVDLQSLATKLKDASEAITRFVDDSN